MHRGDETHDGDNGVSVKILGHHELHLDQADGASHARLNDYRQRGFELFLRESSLPSVARSSPSHLFEATRERTRQLLQSSDR